MTFQRAHRAQTGSAPPILGFTFADDVAPTLDNRDFVEDLLTEKGLSVLYGESNSGKTFLASDLALHVATGLDWFGREVERGAVIYVPGEGAFGIRNRVVAWRQEHRIDLKIPLAVTDRGIDLLNDDGDAMAVRALAAQVTETTGLPVRLIVIDTLSRAMAGGNENAPDDMGALVRNADLLREATGAHVMFVHHSGKDRAAGARGHSLLRAAVDTEIEVAKDGDTTTATVKKQRDLPVDGTFAFTLGVVELGTNQRGKPVTSCVVRPTEVRPPRPTEPDLTPNQRTMFRILHEAGPAGLPWAEWDAATVESGVGANRKATRFDIRSSLASKGLVYERDGTWIARR